jgi:hypothetical protein
LPKIRDFSRIFTLSFAEAAPRGEESGGFVWRKVGSGVGSCLGEGCGEGVGVGRRREQRS